MPDTFDPTPFDKRSAAVHQARQSVLDTILQPWPDTALGNPVQPAFSYLEELLHDNRMIAETPLPPLPATELTDDTVVEGADRIDDPTLREQFRSASVRADDMIARIEAAKESAAAS